MLDCSGDHSPALLRTEYASRRLRSRPGAVGLARYQDWLPVRRLHEAAGRAVVYRSSGLAGEFGLANLWIAFSGWWPERGAVLETATFKELEAYTVLGRLPDSPGILTVASAGNTAAAFALACSATRLPCLLIIPGKGLPRLRFRTPPAPWVRLVTIDDGDYPDAIRLAAAVSAAPPFRPEGGVRNVGRRDGLATVLLAAFEAMQCLPTHYFQAVGSGTGAIAVHEAAVRIRAAADDMGLPQLMLCQNLPFAPVYAAWRTGTSALAAGALPRLRAAAGQIIADELTNWAPPYEITGGLRDSLTQSRGDVLVTDNASVRRAGDMFEALEGIDIEPAAAVAVACLRAAAAGGRLGREAVVLLNVTGGGRARLSREHPLVTATPTVRLRRGSIDNGAAERLAAALSQAGRSAGVLIR